MKKVNPPPTDKTERHALNTKAIQVSIFCNQGGTARYDYQNAPNSPRLQSQKARRCNVLPQQQIDKILFVSTAKHSGSVIATAICNAFQSQTHATASIYDLNPPSVVPSIISTVLQEIGIQTTCEVLPLAPQTIQHFPLIMVLGHERDCPKFLRENGNVLFHPITGADNDFKSLRALREEVEGVIISLFHKYLKY